MFVPSIFTDNFIDTFFDDMFDFPTSSKDHKLPGMNTDIRELDGKYQIEIELPGYSKEDIKADLNDGYLTISAEHTDSSEEKDGDEKYLRRERYVGRCSRSFFIGKDITQEDIRAGFKNGILTLEIPKKTALPESNEKKYISIEG